MSARSSSYQRRSPEHEVLHGLVREHFETMRAQASALGNSDGLPSFVERERASPMAAAGRSPSCSGLDPPSTCNVHMHALVLDGVFAPDGDGLRFHRTPPAEDGDLPRLLATIARRVSRLATGQACACHRTSKSGH